MLKNKNHKTLPKKKILIGAAIAIIAVIVAVIAIMMANNEEKAKKLKRVSDPELARAMTYDQFVDGDENIEGTDYVKFSAFFLRDVNNDGYAEKIKGTCKQIGKEDTLYMEVNVQTEGVLKNGKIEIDGKNFYLVTTAPKDNELKDNYISTNTKVMEFADLNNGTQKLLSGVARSGDYTYTSGKSRAIGSNLNNLSRDDNKIVFTGMYVAADGSETEIRKEIDLSVDWYGSTAANLYASGTMNYDILDRVDTENGTITLDININTEETKKQLNIYKNYVEGTIPQLNGFDPISVTTSSSNITFDYDEATRKFVITRDAMIDENFMITSSVSNSNYYKVSIKYPLEAYEVMEKSILELEVPVMTYYVGYNNSNDEFDSLYKSNEAKKTLSWKFAQPKEGVTTFDIKVGKYVSSPNSRYIVSKKKPLKIYNGQSEEEFDDTYTVRWNITKGTNESNDGVVMKETATGAEQVADKFIKKDFTREMMENLTANVGIGFANADNFLDEDGWIKVYDDETDDLIETFTKENWSKCTETSPYLFDLPVKHIRVETSKTQAEQYFTVYSIKELDDDYITTNYAREQFDELQYINSQVSMYVGDKLLGTANHSANYESPYSIASLSISKNTLSTQVTEEDYNIVISVYGNESMNQALWNNGSFLVKLPQEILKTDIFYVEISDNYVDLISYEYIENDNGKFIKVNTANTAGVLVPFEITINVDITPDPRIATQTGIFELYAANEDVVDYYYRADDIYDVNDNLNTTEKVHKSTASISLIAPNTLLTNQMASEFDKDGTTVVSPQIADVRPPLATVDQDKEEKTIKIGAQIKNNYSSSISEVKILGKIPFEGNTYVINENDMNSEFTTKMTEAGIEIPEALQGKVQVYYSDNKNPDRDLTNADNNWKMADEIENWDNVKTYLIDFQDAELAVGEEYTFYYTVKVPNGIAYNKVAYSHHGVYFALNTAEGKYRTQTEPNKMGIRIAERYGLEIQKYHANKDVLVPGATYKITKEATENYEEEIKTAVTNSEGKLDLENLYAECTYTIEEIKVPENYELNTDVIKFVAHVQEDGSLQIEKIEGTTREDITVVKEQNGEEVKSRIIVKLEDEAKAKLKIVKTEKDSVEPVRGVRFKLTGTGLPENGKSVMTNTNGKITINGLQIGEEYTLEETRATGYYLASPIKFTIANEDGTYVVNVAEGETKVTSVEEVDNIPVVTLSIEDEKIPTYDLEIAKIKKVTSVTEGDDGTQDEEIVYLAGAKFKLYKGSKELGSYVTDENGKIAINGLYQYIDGKDEEAVYVLKETLAPDGYAKVKDISFKVDGSTGELKFVNTEEKEEKYTVDGSTVKLTIEDSPSFKLIKKDAETGEVIANVKFAIYDVEEGTTPAKNSKGEILGTKEVIDGKEYYTVTTDANGELTADLPEGMYKAVEVWAPEKYDISDSVYYFGIGASREGKERLKPVWGQGIGGRGYDTVTEVVSTSDGGYIVAGFFEYQDIDLGNGVSLINNGRSDGMIIKYDSKENIEWAKVIGGAYSEQIYAVTLTSDGGYIIGGIFESGSIDLGDGATLTNKSNGRFDGMVIKYASDGKVEWAQGIGEGEDEYIISIAETSDGGYVVGGYFESDSIDFENGLSLSNKGCYDGMLIKYNSEGNVEWVQGIGGTYFEYIVSVAETSDGGCIVGGRFNSSSIDIGDGISLSNKGNYDGMLIKYNSEGNIEWTQVIGDTQDDSISSVIETSDGGWIVGGQFESSSIDFENGINLRNKGNADGMIIKYNSEGNVEWLQGVGGTEDECITSVAKTNDGGYIVGGSFGSSTIDLGNGLSASNEGFSSDTDAMLIKYNSNGMAEWIQGVAGWNDEVIKSVAEIDDGSYIVGGSFTSKSLDIVEEITLNNKGSVDGMIIKFEKVELPNPVVDKAIEVGGSKDDKIEFVSATSDGGYIVGGSFYSNSVELGNGIKLINKNTSEYKLSDAMVIKYRMNGTVEWTRGIGGSYNDEIKSVKQTSDGGYIAVGYFDSETIDLGNGVSLSTKGSQDGMIIKYNSKGEVEWANTVGGDYYEYIESILEISDGGYLAVGKFTSESLNLGNGIILTSKSTGAYDGMIIKYNSKGEVEWAKSFGGNISDSITSVEETRDQGFIISGWFDSNDIDLGNGIVVTNKNSSLKDGMIIKYNFKGEVEWARGIGGSSDDEIKSVKQTSDDGYLAVGYFRSGTIELGNEILLENKNNWSNKANGMLVKYSSSGEVEWAKPISGKGYVYISDIILTNDGGYLLGGYFDSQIIELDNDVSIVSNGDYDGIVLKYNDIGELEWTEQVGGTDYDRITSVTELKSGAYLIGGYFESSNINFKNDVGLSNVGAQDGMILKIVNQIGVPEEQELEVKNERKKFKITTDVQEIDGIKGGMITGEDATPYEKVKYGDSSTQEIKMIPDENYEIIGITINGKEYKFTANDDGSYIMPAFTNVTENKHIVVTYSLKNNKITINKVDKDTKKRLSGATFKLDQIEERSTPNNSEIIGELTDNGQKYTEVEVREEATVKLGELTNNGTYYFVQNDDGTYTPTNSKTYQVANGGTAGKSNVTANSYITIDLTNLTGQYAIVINASCSSESTYDYGYATITENTMAPAYNSDDGRFMYISGVQSTKDYTSGILEGGKIYYLHLGYRKDGSGDSNDDQVVINSINLYNAGGTTNVYNFKNNDGKYESTNQGKDSTVANSYIPIDLTNCTGKYNLLVNAEVSSQASYDYGYVTVTENTTRPSYSSSTGRFVYISGTQTAKDYTTVLQGGKMYYLHLGYYKNATTSTGDDRFTVNSVSVTLNDSELYHTTVETNSDGQAITQIPFGKYAINEIQAPDGYWINETPRIVEFRSTEGAVHEFTIENEAKAKLIVHHYIKGTTTKLAEDEIYESKTGEKYTTSPKLDLNKYELEVDENGKHVLPENAVGTYKTGTTEVTYYYVEKKIPLTVHHYIEGTTEKVPLKAGDTANDITESGNEGENYTTSAIADEELSDEYELVEVPSNASGTYSGDEVIITYYYKKVSRDVNLIKYQEDGATPLEGAKFAIENKDDSKNNIIKAEEIRNNGTYYFENDNGKYISNNKNKSSTTANSYIKIDMTNSMEDATVTVNAEISSEGNYDYGYATITQAETAPAYNTSTGRFVYISGSQSAKDYSATLKKGSIYYLHLGYRKDSSGNTGADTFTINSIKINDIDYLGYSKTYTTNEQGKIQVDLEAGTYEVKEIEAPEGYKLPDNPTTEITISKATTSEDITITNEKKTGTVTVHHYIEGTTDSVPLSDGTTASDEIKTGNVGDIYASTARTDISEGYELVVEPDNASGTYIDGNIDVIYYYKTIPTSVIVHHYLEGTTTKLAEDVKFDGIVGDNYTTGVGNVDNKYELVAIPANANGKMTRNQIEVIYYYRLKDTSVLVHHYKEGTSESLSADVTINGKVDDEYTTAVATDIPSKYELVAEPDNKAGTMTVEQTVVTYYYRLKETGVDVHYYKEGTTEKISEDVEITGRVDDTYTTTPATNVASKYELVTEPDNKAGTMTEDRITVIYYYRLKDTSVLVHHYLEGTTTSLSPDETINGQVDDTYRTVESTDLLFGKYDLVAEPDNKTGIMTEDQIVVTYYYRLKDTSVLVHHYIKDTTTSLSADVTINGQIDDEYTTTIANDIPEQYELVAEPDNKAGTMSKEQIVVTYYYQLKNYPYVVNYLEKDTDKVLHEAKQGEELVYGSTVNSADEKIDIDGYKFDSYNQDVLTIGTTNNVINIYYTKRNDLSYKVNYLEKDTNKVLHEQKVQNGVTFEDEITAVNEVIAINGYNYDSVDKATLKITTGENVINIYYTKRNDLNYKVNYLEKTTNEVLYEQKVQNGMTYEDEITSANEVIAIDGYNYDSVDKDTLVIGTSENVINIYYTKKNDLSYKVNYLEKDTNKVLSNQKVVENMTFKDEITSANEVISINGYNYDSVDKNTLVIGTSENVINIYYTKRNDLSYTVNYLESVTNKVLHEPKVQTGMTYEDKVNAEDEVIDINGYNYDYPDKYELVIGTDENVINIYYSKVTGLSYTVNYLEKDTNKTLFPSNNQGDMTFGDVINSSDEVITIDGYNFNSFDKDTLTIGTGENVINIYYTKRTDLGYKVNYLEKDTNKVLHDQKVVENMTFEDEIISANEVITIDGYNYDSVDKTTLKITTGENIINVYYTKRNDLSYKVNYLEKDTNKILHEQKTQGGMTFEDEITSANEVITIDGYNYDSVDKATLKITTGENVINIYYAKRADLSYKVNYLEKDTNKVLSNQKVVNNMTFEDEVTSANEVITIDGYNYDSVDKATLKITTGENIINVYYTKRNDLSYTVNYLEKDTNKVLSNQKIVENVTFEDEVTSANEVITIDGYNYDSTDKATLKITTGENVINIYYTKRNNLSYTVNYLEKNTNKVIHAPKVTGNMTFEDEITSADEIITINGYSYDSVDKDKLVITTGENTINIYYTKINGLAYTVNYLEKDTDKVIHTPKTTDNMTFEDEITSADEVIEIDGYNYDSVDKDTLVIGTGTNIINIYYTKRNDLSYTVNYLEKDTNKVLHGPKTQDGMTFESTVASTDEVIDIDGYDYNSVDKEALTITTGENIINIYYTKRNDLNYKVNYLEKDTNKVIHDQKVVENVTFEDEITSANEVITIYGYNYDSVDKDTLVIGTNENVINVYYIKKEAKVTVHYYEENTTNKVSEDKEITGKVNDEYVTAIADDIPSKYELVATPANATGTMTEDTIEVIYYFRKKATQVIVRHYEEGTTIKLSEDVTIEGRIDDPYTTVAATDVPIKYELSVTPANANGTMTENTIEVIYYYRVKDAVLNIRYLEKNTNIELAQPEQQHGKVDEEYITGAKTIDGYTLVEHSGNERGKFEVNPLTVTYYYLYNTKATVQYIDKITGQILEQSTTEGLEGDDFVTESKSFDNYILVEEPAQKTVKMTKDEQVLKYYYIHVSGGVIEKHIDMISGEILSNDTHQGNEGDTYNIPSRTFQGYDLVEDRLPANAQGTMTVNPIEVIYYYIYKSKVTAQYVDKNTGEKLTEDEEQNGHEKDAYITDRKTFDDYKLVEVPANADGEMTKKDITVTYNYVHTSGGVIVNHIDINTGKQLLDETKQEGYEGDPYETHEENIPGYTLVKEKYPENAKGIMAREETRVTYYYVKNTEVNIKYIDKETGEEITEKTNIPGKEGENYTTEPKDIPGYDLVEEPANKDGTMAAEPIDVIYYYRRPAKVVVKYIDQETNEEIATEEKQEGHQNDEYTTEAKDIKYYKLIATPDNATGTMKVTVTKDENGKDIVEDTTYVTYYYRKLIFNLNIDKKVSSVTVNGEESIINGDLGKVEVHRKELNTAKVEVKYIIKVTNDSELTGKASILEDIPTGMIMNAEKNAGWEVKGTTATRETKELQPGESEEYLVVLDWENGENNIGMKENTASIISTENEAGFEEKDTTDNEDKADVIVAIGTGGHTYVLIAGGMLLILISLACGVYIIKRENN